VRINDNFLIVFTYEDNNECTQQTMEFSVECDATLDTEYDCYIFKGQHSYKDYTEFRQQVEMNTASLDYHGENNRAIPNEIIETFECYELESEEKAIEYMKIWQDYYKSCGCIVGDLVVGKILNEEDM